MGVTFVTAGHARLDTGGNAAGTRILLDFQALSAHTRGAYPRDAQDGWKVNSVSIQTDETRSENSHARRTEPPVLAPALDQDRQRKRMLLALGVLLVALFAVILKDWDFWFPSGNDDEVSVSPARKKVAEAMAPAASAPVPREHRVEKNSPAAEQPPFTATTERAALPPLQVEVVAGNRHMPVAARNNAIRVDVGSPAGSPSDRAASAPATSADSADHVQLSPQAAQSVSVSVPPNYPLLARQMKVQGMVSLQALISKEGSIQELQVLNGPEILAAAAREAVKQWRFKPYLQNGQPVETQARITVNFTISTN